MFAVIGKNTKYKPRTRNKTKLTLKTKIRGKANVLIALVTLTKAMIVSLNVSVAYYLMNTYHFWSITGYLNVCHPLQGYK